MRMSDQIIRSAIGGAACAGVLGAMDVFADDTLAIRICAVGAALLGVAEAVIVVQGQRTIRILNPEL